jgi:glycosyltransferase involved in cell wall biosynthesis
VFFGHDYRERVVAYGTADAPDGAEHQITKFRATIPALGQRPYILFLSRIHRKKGCDILLDGFAAIAARHPMVHLVIAGPDQTGWRRSLDQQARALGLSDRLHWPGMLMGDAKWGAFRAAEAFILPSHQENFGLAVTEALSCSTPVLISDKVNICQEVANASCGFVEEDSKQGVTRLLDRFLTLDASSRERMRKSARQTFLARFEAHSAARDLINVVKEIRVARQSDYHAAVT